MTIRLRLSHGDKSRDRLSSLTSPEGWTTLIGLYWLQEGNNVVGSSNENTVVFPEQAPDVLCTFHKQIDTISVENHLGDNLQVNGKKFSKEKVSTDTDKELSKFQWQRLIWYVIKRGDKYGIRLKDTLSETRLSLTSLPHFPVDIKWKVAATLTPPNEGEAMIVDNALGQKEEYKLEGRLKFEMGGKSHTLAAVDGGPDDLWIIMADGTTGDETYGGGRFLYCPRPVDGKTTIDFNKAYNPPCVYTDFATCPLPTSENVLDVSILAGELYDGSPH